MRTTLGFFLRPETRALLKQTGGGNVTVKVLRWLKEYIENPKPLKPIDDNLEQINIRAEKHVADSIRDLASKQGISMMAMLRLIVEHRIKDEQLIEQVKPDEIKKAIREVLLEQQSTNTHIT